MKPLFFLKQNGFKNHSKYFHRLVLEPGRSCLIIVVKILASGKGRTESEELLHKAFYGMCYVTGQTDKQVQTLDTY